MVWSNLFGACLGGEGSPPREQHCDTRKGDRESPLLPLDPMLAERLRHSAGGRSNPTSRAWQTICTMCSA